LVGYLYRIAHKSAPLEEDFYCFDITGSDRQCKRGLSFRVGGIDAGIQVS